MQYNFFHNWMIYLQLVPRQQSQNPEIKDSGIFVKLLKKTELLVKYEFADKREFELMEMRESNSYLPVNPH